jgi:uncharacterized membrane protein YjgN (DUF898 family)
MDSHEASPARDAPVAFNGANADFRRLVTRGALLELVTFGFYRFWLTTDIRRHLWSNTEIDGDSLEYTGRGKELLLGFLIALAILIAVGTRVTARPPHRTVRAAFPHTAPTLGV